MTTYYLDYVNGNDTNDGTSWAQAWKTITSGATAARIAPGDTIRIAKSPDPTELGSCTWTNASRNIAIPSGTIKNVDMCETGWVASANVTKSETTTYAKEGTYATQLDIAAGFTTGKVAYKAFSEQDFSAYQQINLWFIASAALAAGVLRVCLCSDAAGDTVVDSFDLPAHIGFSWYCPVVVDKGSALGSSIQSVALYAVSDPGTVTVRLDDIFVSKAPSAADCLTLRSVISKGGTGIDACYFGINDINGTTLRLSNTPAANGANSNQKTYKGTTETVTTYVRQTIYKEAGESIQDSGTLGNLITFSGGWNTSTSECDGITFIWQFKNIAPINFNGKSFLKFEHLGFSGSFNDACLNAISNNYNVEMDDIWVCNASNPVINAVANVRSWRLSNFYVGNSDGRFSISGSAGGWAVGIYATNIFIDGSIYVPFFFTSVARSRFVSVTMRGCSGAYMIMLRCCYKIDFVNPTILNGAGCGAQLETYSRDIRFYNLVSSGNTSGIVLQGGCECSLFNPSIAEATEVSFSSANYNDDSIVWSINHDGAADTHRTFMTGGLISSGTTVRHTESGISWQLSPTSANRTELWPIMLQIATVAVEADGLVTLSVWVRRSNTGVSARLWVPGGQIAGLSDDVTDDAIGAQDEWENLSVEFTPTENGVVEAYINVWGGTTYSVYVDDFAISQA